MTGRGECRRRSRLRGATPLAIALCLALLAPAAAAGAGTGDRGRNAAARDRGAQASIIGGHPAPIADFPSLAFVASPHSGCTGTVVAPRVVLTAAHCVEDLERGGYVPAHGFRVVTGLSNPYAAKAADITPALDARVSPFFIPGPDRSDAAILILARPVAAPPIALATSADRALYAAGTRVDLAGWGLNRSAQLPKLLQATSVAVQSNARCRSQTAGYFPDFAPRFELCTADPPKFETGGCFGDSGGPAIARRADGTPVQIGIVNTGGPFCSTQLPNVLARTETISAWANGWIAAVETGAAQPRGASGLPPRLLRRHAFAFINSVLGEDFGRPYYQGDFLWHRCRGSGSSALTCGLIWHGGRNLYTGVVTVAYRVRHGGVIWHQRYRFASSNYRCRIHGEHPRRCPKRIHRG